MYTKNNNNNKIYIYSQLYTQTLISGFLCVFSRQPNRHCIKTRKQTWLLATDPSGTIFEEDEESASEDDEDDFGDGLADSERAGHETAPITGPTSTTPFDGLFQAGFFGRAALPLVPSELSAAAATGEEESSTGGGEVEAETEAAWEGEELSAAGSGREVGGGGGGGDDEGE